MLVCTFHGGRFLCCRCTLVSSIFTVDMNQTSCRIQPFFSSCNCNTMDNVSDLVSVLVVEWSFQVSLKTKVCCDINNLHLFDIPSDALILSVTVDCSKVPGMWSSPALIFTYNTTWPINFFCTTTGFLCLLHMETCKSFMEINFASEIIKPAYLVAECLTYSFAVVVLIAAYSFQENLLKTMLHIESTFRDLADSSSCNCLIICDRGSMDAAAC